MSKSFESNLTRNEDQIDEKQKITLNINNENFDLEIDSDTTLLYVLREMLNLTGSKQACDDGECGSCFVLYGEKALMSCKMKAQKTIQKPIVTIEGLSGETDKHLHPLQKTFLDAGATQCGFCIPGMIMRSEALLRKNKNPNRKDIVKALSGNLCRCTGYVKIIDAVLNAANLKNDVEIKKIDNLKSSSNKTLRKVGSSVKRIDTPATVTGKALYAADLKKDGMLHAKILRSPHHHAKIISIDTSKAEKLYGVEKVVTASDIPGTSVMSNCQPQTYLFPNDKVRFLGEAVAAVAAKSEKLAEKALNLINVEYETLPSLFSIDDAIKSDAVSLFDNEPNISPETELLVGNVDEGFESAEIVIEDIFTTNRREHAAMEPEASLAYLDNDGMLVIHAPLYHPFVQGQQSIAANLDLDINKVRIICPAMGGNFGTRGDVLCATISGLLAICTKKPVRLVYNRSESILSSSKTPSTKIQYKLGASKDGKLTALEAKVYKNVGTWAPYLAEKTTEGQELCRFESIASTMAHITGPYFIPNVKTIVMDVVTNGPRAVPLRGTSGGFLPFAIESIVDRLASKLKIDPLDFRIKNTLKIGSVAHTGQIMKESVGIDSELKNLRRYYDEFRKNKKSIDLNENTPWRRGVGLGCGWRSITYVGMPSISAGAELMDDGRIQVLAGSVEQGQGVTTQFAQIASEELSLPMELIKVTIGDTFLAPYPVPTFSSVTTSITGKAVQLAAEKLKKVLIESSAKLLDTTIENIIIKNGFFICEDNKEVKISLKELYDFFSEKKLPIRYEGTVSWQGLESDGKNFGDKKEKPDILYGYNAGVVELEVNINTGQTRVLKIINASDPGTIINPQALEGQVEGGVAFGIGIALSESFNSEKKQNFREYGLPRIKDIPEIVEPIFVEDPLQKGPFGAKSAGEMPLISVVPAIINALSDATGKRIRELPATPEVVCSSLGN